MPPPAAPDAALQRQRLLSEKPCVMRDDDADPREVSHHLPLTLAITPPPTPFRTRPSPRGRKRGREREGGRKGWAGGWNVRMTEMGDASAMHAMGVFAWIQCAKHG